MAANRLGGTIGDGRTLERVVLGPTASAVLGPIERGVLEELGDDEVRATGRPLPMGWCAGTSDAAAGVDWERAAQAKVAAAALFGAPRAQIQAGLKGLSAPRAQARLDAQVERLVDSLAEAGIPESVEYRPSGVASGWVQGW